MKKKYMYGIMMTGMILLMTGCQNHEESKVPASVGTIDFQEIQSVESSEAEQYTEELYSEMTEVQEDVVSEIVNEPVLSIEPAVERFIAQREHYEFTDKQTEYSTKVTIFANKDIKHFEYIEINPDIDEDGNMHCSDSKVLYSIEEFKTNEYVVIELEYTEIIPNRAVRYTDADGKTYCFYIAESGEDGMPFLEPVDIDK